MFEIDTLELIMENKPYVILFILTTILIWFYTLLYDPSKHLWKYELEENYILRNKVFVGKRFENDWIEIMGDEGILIIKKGYAWDGATPKYHFLGIWVWGTPDGILRKGKPWLYYPTLVHDVFCQWQDEVPFTREEVHGLFLEMMEETKWPLAKLYFKIVWWFGPKKFGDD